MAFEGKYLSEAEWRFCVHTFSILTCETMNVILTGHVNKEKSLSFYELMPHRTLPHGSQTYVYGCKIQAAGIITKLTHVRGCTESLTKTD
jgi:hypothetical protein